MYEFDFSTVDPLAKIVIAGLVGDKDPESRVFVLSGEGKLPPDGLAINGNPPTIMQEGTVTHKQRGDQGRFEIIAKDNGKNKQEWIIIIGTRYDVTLNGKPPQPDGERFFEFAGPAREVLRQRIQDALYPQSVPTTEAPKSTWIASAQNFSQQGNGKLSPYAQRLRPVIRAFVNLVTHGHS